MARPVKWKTPEEMQVAIDAYFDSIEAHNIGVVELHQKKHPTVTGLGIAVDLTRTGLIEYCRKTDEFSHTIKKAKARVEEYIEQRLYSNNATGCIFNLKNNFDWKDSSETISLTKEIPITAEDKAIAERYAARAIQKGD